MIGQKISQYLILEKLGEGGMGVVYLAEDTVLGRRVAFKSLKNDSTPEYSQFKTRFLREARLASTLNHPNIVSIYDYGETEGGLPYLVMEYVRGSNLSDVLRRGQLTVAECVEIIKQIARALAEAHDHGIVHRDLKPSNIFINERGEVKVLDFGLAKLLDADSYNSKSLSEAGSELFTQTREGVFMGTPSYSSPEQLVGTEIDRRSDIFSLGAIFYECLSGQPAFAGKNFAEICAQVIKDDPRPPSEVNLAISAEYDGVALKALSKKAENRYQTVEELIKDLDTVPVNQETQKFSINADSAVSKTASGFSLSAVPTFFKQNRLLAAVFAILTITALIFAASGTLRKLFSPPVSVEVPASYNEGVSALHNGNYYKAKKLLEMAVQQNDQFPLAHARLADALIELDFEDDATKEILRVTQLTPTFANLSEIDQLNLQAVAATVGHNYDGAIQNYRKIVEKSPEADKKFAYFDLARALQSNDETDKAIESFVEATRRDPNFAAAHLKLGKLYGRKQETEKANAAFAKAEEIYNGQSDYDGVAEVYYQRGYLLNVQEKFPEASEKLKRALELAKLTKNASLQVKTLLALCSIAYSVEDHPAAQRYVDEAIELARTEQLDYQATVGLLDLGNIFFTRGKYDEAESKFSLALQRGQANEWKTIQARASLSLASLYVQQTKAAEAIKLLEPTLEFYQKNNFSREALQAQSLLGSANDLSGNYETALSAFSEQSQIATKLDDQTMVYYAHDATAQVFAHQEKFSEALVRYDESLSEGKSLGLGAATGWTSLGRGQVLWQLGRYKESREALEAAAAVAAKPDSGDKQLLGWTQLVRAESDLSQQNYKAALAGSQKALEVSGASGGEIFVQATITKGLANSRSGARAAGVELCRKALAEATKTGMAYILLKARIALAEALLTGGDAQESLNVLLELQKSLTDSGNLPTQWESLMIASKASSVLKDTQKSQDYAARADELLSELEKNLGAENQKSYLSRLDIQNLRK